MGPVADVAQCPLLGLEIDSVASLDLNNPTPASGRLLSLANGRYGAAWSFCTVEGIIDSAIPTNTKEPKNDAAIFSQATDIYRRLRRLWRSIPWVDAGGLDRPLCD